jgi:hypothetical protein
MGDSTDSAKLPAPARFWTVAEANRRLDGLRELLPRVRAWAVRLRAIAEERERLAAFWGTELRATDHPDRGLVERLDQEATTLNGQLEHEVEGLQAEGIEVKDLDSGLIDFYAVLDKEVVFLCWRRGEPDVGYFHRLDGGFRTRRPIVPSAGDAVAGRRSHS